MFISPHTAIREGWITHPKCQSTDDWEQNKFISPNAIDFTLDRAFKVNDDLPFYVSENRKRMKGSEPLPIVELIHNEPGWVITAQGMLDGLSDIYCDLPEGVSAMLVIRSTLARNGIQLVSGLYDSGFQGHVGFLLHNRSRTNAQIANGTRVGQIIFVKAESAGLYAGGYNHEQGTDLEYQNGLLYNGGG